MAGRTTRPALAPSLPNLSGVQVFAVIFTAIFLLHADGRKEHLLNEAMIEQVFFVPGG